VTATLSPALTPGSPQWLRTVTASKVPAILGVSPYESPLSMWLTMRGDIPPAAETDAMRRGHLLEPGVLAWWSSQHPDGYVVYEQRTVWLDSHGWAAATPDMLAVVSGQEVCVEAKTAARAEEWGEPGTDQAPAHYVVQALWQLACAPTSHRVYIPVLFGPGLRFAEYVIERDDDLIGAIIDRARTFYDSLDSDVPPDLDDHPATLEALRKLHDDIDRDLDAEVTEFERDEWLATRAELESAETRHRAATARLLDRMGRARRAMCNGAVVARRQPHAHGGVALVRVAPLTGDYRR
jgi:putative phage-type endonuclease